MFSCFSLFAGKKKKHVKREKSIYNMDGKDWWEGISTDLWLRAPESELMSPISPQCVFGD